MTRKSMALVLLTIAAILSLLLSACGAAATTTPVPASTVAPEATQAPAPTAAPAPTMTQAPAQAETRPRFVLVSHGNLDDWFWLDEQRGMEDAAKLFGADVVMQWANGDLAKQVDYLNAAIASKPDGIGTTITDDKALDEPIQRALEAGIPVIAFNVDDSEARVGNSRLAFVGQDFVNSGYMLGKKMLEVADKSAPALYFTVMPTANFSVKRYAGVKKALDEAGIKSEMLDAGYTNQAEVAARIQGFLRAHPEVKTVIGGGGLLTAGGPLAVKELGLTPGKDIMIGGFDLSELILQQVVDGEQYAVIDQQAWLQAFMTVQQLYFMKTTPGFAPFDVDTGGARGALITKDKAAVLLERMKQAK